MGINVQDAPPVYSLILNVLNAESPCSDPSKPYAVTTFELTVSSPKGKISVGVNGNRNVEAYFDANAGNPKRGNGKLGFWLEHGAGKLDSIKFTTIDGADVECAFKAHSPIVTINQMLTALKK